MQAADGKCSMCRKACQYPTTPDKSLQYAVAGRTGLLTKVHAAGANGIVDLSPVEFLDRLAD